MRALWLCGLCLTGLGAVGPVDANLLITPKRLVLQEAWQRGSFSLVNTTNAAKSYQLRWRQLRMREGGGLEEVDDPLAPGNASSLVMVSPERVFLQPGETQTVRVRAQLPANLPVGEYISHLTFQPVSETGFGLPGPADGVSLALRVNLGFSVPVIVRHGPISASLSLSPRRIDRAAGWVEVRVKRSGQASSFGNLELYWGQPGQTGHLVGRLNGVAVYANVNYQDVRVPLQPPAGIQIGPGLLQVLYRDPDTGDRLAEHSVLLR